MRTKGMQAQKKGSREFVLRTIDSCQDIAEGIVCEQWLWETGPHQTLDLLALRF